MLRVSKLSSPPAYGISAGQEVKTSRSFAPGVRAGLPDSRAGADHSMCGFNESNARTLKIVHPKATVRTTSSPLRADEYAAGHVRSDQTNRPSLRVLNLTFARGVPVRGIRVRVPGWHLLMDSDCRSLLFGCVAPIYCKQALSCASSPSFFSNGLPLNVLAPGLTISRKSEFESAGNCNLMRHVGCHVEGL